MYVVSVNVELSVLSWKVNLYAVWTVPVVYLTNIPPHWPVSDVKVTAFTAAAVLYLK